MKLQRIFDNVSNFLIHPSNQGYKPCTKRCAWFVTFFIGFITAGIPHGLCFLWLKLRKVSSKPEHKKIQDVFNKNLSRVQKQLEDLPFIQKLAKDLSPAQKPVENLSPKTPETVIFTQNDLQNLAIQTPDINLNLNFIQRHYKDRENKMSFRTLGADWFVWFDPPSRRILLQNKSSFERNSDLDKLELQITENQEQISIQNNHPDSKYVRLEYQSLLLNLHHEITSLRFVTDHISQHSDFTSQEAVFFVENDTLQPNPDSISEKATSLPYIKENDIRLDPISQRIHSPERPVGSVVIRSNEHEENLQNTHSNKFNLVDDELIETQDQPIPNVNNNDEPGKLSCPQDWILFQSSLSQKSLKQIDLGSLGIFSARLDEQKKNLIIITKQSAINQLPALASDDFLMEIQLDVGGNFSSFEVNKKQLLPLEFIPKQYFSILNGCFKKALEETNTYMTDSYRIFVARRSLSKIPEAHLLQLYNRLKYTHDNRKSEYICFKFQSDNLENESGIDSGGLSRQYFEEVFKNLLYTRKLNFFKCRTELVMPESKLSSGLNSQEKDIYFALGYIMGYLYLSNDKNTGIYFDDAFFRAILACESNEIDQPFKSLSLESKLRMAEAIIQSRQENVGNDPIHHLFLCTKLLREQINKQASPEAKEQLKSVLENAGVMYLENMPDRFVDHDKEKLQFEAINEQKEEFLQALYHEIFNHADVGYGKIQRQIEPIHRTAQGMKAIFSHSLNWSSIQQNGHEDLAEKIQGSRDRQKIVDCIVYDQNELDPIKIKVQWLKEWILDPNTTHKQVGLFLKFVTGVTTLTKESIKIEKHYKNSPLPAADTCSCKLKLSAQFSEMSTSEGVYTDETKEGFIKVLTDMVFKEQNMGFHTG